MSDHILIYHWTHLFRKEPILARAFAKFGVGVWFHPEEMEGNPYLDYVDALREFARGRGGEKWQDNGNPNKGRTDTVAPVERLIRKVHEASLALIECEKVANIDPEHGQINVARAFIWRMLISPAERDLFESTFPTLQQRRPPPRSANRGKPSGRDLFDQELSSIASIAKHCLETVGRAKGTDKPEHLYYYQYVEALAKVCSASALPVLDASGDPEPDFLGLLREVQEILPPSLRAASRQSLRRRASKALAEFTPVLRAGRMWPLSEDSTSLTVLD
jgi:hypothetical protein